MRYWLLKSEPDVWSIDQQEKAPNEGQDESVETDLLRDQDKRMPIKIDRNSKHTFGGTKK